MVPIKDIQDLVKAHVKLDEPMTCAIHIYPQKQEVWLIECVPSMENEDQAGEPVRFNPGFIFRFPLALVAANMASLESAIIKDMNLAEEIYYGNVLYSVDGAAEHLQNVARTALGTYSRYDI